MTMSSDLGLISVPTSAGPITTITTVTSSTRRSTSATTTKGGDKDEKSAGSIPEEKLCLSLIVFLCFEILFFMSI